ncbi:MAG: chloride channel protein [Polyangiales bacterium]
MRALGARLGLLARWLVLGAIVGVVCGLAASVFLYALGAATDLRTRHTVLVYALPLVGLALGALYERFGGPIRGGNDLVIDTLHDLGPRLPLRMAPMVLVGTVLTHLFGGSAGREGTAVQMGASLSDALGARLRVDPVTRHALLAAGVAGGFGAVFGTPAAGTVFALELVVIGQLGYAALLPALVAALVGNLTTHALGPAHLTYPPLAPVAPTLWMLVRWVPFAAAVALMVTVFIELTHWLKRVGASRVPRLPVRMFLGGALVVVAWRLLGSDDYLGLSLPLLTRALVDPTLPAYAFAAKLGLTAITLGAGFLGGEVTPLFVMGAALGNLLAAPLSLPLELAAAVGLAASFGCAANAPLALSLMAVELFGASILPHALIVCVLSYLLTGHRGIYAAQRIGRPKDGVTRTGTALRALREESERKETSEPRR